MKLGRFVIDTHVHAQRFAVGKALREQQQRSQSGEREEWEQLSGVLSEVEPYDNSERLLYDMECYDVDMCVLLPAFGMTDDLNRKIVEKHPDRFVAECMGDAYMQRVVNGEEEWSIEGQCAELDQLLSTGKFVGIGEKCPYMPVTPGRPPKPVGPETAVENMLAIMEVAKRHNVVARVHSGNPMGYDLPYYLGTTGPSDYKFGATGPFNYNPLWVHDLASVYPDMPIVISHGGIQGWWSEKFYEECLHVAAAHDNVYLETGLWWSELYDKAMADPNIGADKLLWGTDWGASMPFYNQPGRYPESYPVQLRGKGVVEHQVDFWGWSLRELARVRISQDDMNLILGGNAARIYVIKMPHTRLFRPTGK